ncbi:TetR/AcrR family transcriptional regulator [Streptomyces sp. NPDC059740]|uniref:TetR/AcrR family transcriptional regulator n=1 Tax=Streptomyces sp. NPDC059740 TaxID=3346926 RepID=UPI0036585259
MRKAGGRPRNFDRRTALEQALHQFWRHGYEATSIASLTSAMGINPPSLYGAFGDKRQLFNEAVQEYGRTYGAFTTRALAEETTACAAIGRLLREAAREYTDPSHPPGCMVITAATNCTPTAEDVQRQLRDRREESKQAMRDKITADVDHGRLPVTVDAEGLATFYAATLQGMSTQACDGAARSDLERVAELAMSAWPAPAPQPEPDARP